MKLGTDSLAKVVLPGKCRCVRHDICSSLVRARFLLLWCLTALMAAACASRRPLPRAPTQVWLLHGLGRTYASMEPMRGCLEEEGYVVHDWPYSSLDNDIPALGKRLRSDLDAADGRVHLVTHSMGGIIVRVALQEGRPRSVGRVVMLAPPNQGSSLATMVTPLLGDWLPVVRQLRDEADSLVNQLGPVRDVEVGIIAGSRDQKVSVANTHLDGAADHVVVDSAHTFIMNRDVSCVYVQRFLKRGRFGNPK